MKKVVFFLAVVLLSFAAKAQVTTFPWTEDFEGGSIPSTFTLIDNDGDGYGWGTFSGADYAHSGTYVATSASYASTALTPDNWMVLPAMTLPSNASDFTLSWWVRAQDPSWSAEYYSVYVATGNTVAAFTATTAIYSGTSTGEYVKHTFSLANYAGQTIYIAFRHYNCTDMFRLNIDDIYVGASTAPELTITGPTSVINGTAATYTATTDATTLAWYVDGTQQTATGTTFTTTFTTDGNHTVVASATNANGTTSDTVITNVVTCNPITTFPLTENFENGLNVCWTVVSNNTANASLLGVYADANAHGGSKDFRFSSYNSASDYNQYLISPELSLDNNTTYTLKFWYKGYNAQEKFRVMTSSTTNATSAFVQLADVSTTATTWTEVIYTLPANTKYVAINYYGNYQYYLYVDDIYIGGPTVPSLSIEGPTAVAYNTTATYTVTSDVSTFNWFLDGVQQSETGATFTHTFTTLGTYTVKVSATNSVGTAFDSIVTDVVDPTVNSFPWVEDFESVTLNSSGIGAMPVGWTTYADNVPNYSQYAYYGQSWSVYDFGWQGQSAFCMTYTGSTSPCDRWMVTPQLVLPAASDYRLKFDLYASPYGEKLAVKVSTTGNAKADFTQTLMPTTTLSQGGATKMFDLSAYAGQSIYIAFQCTTTDGMYTVVDNVSVGEFAPYGIAYLDGLVASTVPVGTNFDFYTLVQNQGSVPMTSYTLTYTLNNGTPLTRTVSGINVAPYETYIDTITISYPTVGDLTIGLEVSAPNGQADPDTTDNAGILHATVYDTAAAVQRISLLEHFTTAVCPNCPPAHTRLDNVMEGFENRIAWVAHHVGYYTDNYTLPADETGIMGFYSANGGTSTFAPGMMLDRDLDNVPVSEGGMVGSVGYASTIQSQFANATSKPAFVTIELQNVSYNASTRVVSFDVAGQFKQTFTGTINLTVYITEDSLMGTQSGASGQYRHDHVLRAVITDYWGDALTSTNADDTYNKHYTYTLPATWNYAKCRLIAFVNKHDASTYMNRQVLNATKSGFLTPTLGVENVKPAISVKMWPNPVAEMAFVEAESTIRSYEVVNALGQRVMGAEHVNASALELNVSGLAAGVYFVSVTTDNGVSTERLSVVK